MLSSVKKVANADRHVPPNPGDLAPASDTVPITWLGPIDDEDRVLVLGGPGPELMCALLRAGAPNVTHLRACERAEANSASMINRAAGTFARLAGGHVPVAPPYAYGPRPARVGDRGSAHDPDPPDADAARPERHPCAGRERRPGGHRRAPHSLIRLRDGTMRIPLTGVGGSLTALARPFRHTRVDWDVLSRLSAADYSRHRCLDRLRQHRRVRRPDPV
jgi:hypothetical protein